ncbi:acyl-CoA dehydrogenase [Jatrophihabitans endophyticus]|uniref:Acyl-CoA dehydrogenase n=1 Tax=Jatrophihabitans endophyticus TaxID=1206085 RepID=A0A1M5Q140_9ACTN|nr:acyl-CoA dehydrogenase family protein [Jatrophihabitans endophyticus]SHH07758.1 acyl-CoA dehydrogenase [Jatrophihabitans endophyticus]
MDFEYDERTQELRARLTDFMAEFVYPAEPLFADDATSGWERPAVMAELRAAARERGLWNLFLPHHSDGAGLTNLQYAPLAEITGRSPEIAPEVFNCNPPDTGNMELLSLFGTPAQQERWLRPLLAGEIKSAFCMTEPDVSSSDPANLGAQAVRDGDEYVLTGRKWWSTGGMSEDCRVLVVMCVTDPDASTRDRFSMLLVPREAAGVSAVRGLSIFGYDHRTSGGHAEMSFDGVRVPAADVLGEVGKGSAMAQARLGPGRIHHCMRMIGMAERAVDLMCERATRRSTFGRLLGEHGVVQQWIADARVQIEQLRLLVLRTAWLIDTRGAREARRDISAIKVAAPQAVESILDRAIQIHGAAGMTADLPLAMLWAQARTMRFIDGPDEVHRMVLAKRELARFA